MRNIITILFLLASNFAYSQYEDMASMNKIYNINNIHNANSYDVLPTNSGITNRVNLQNCINRVLDSGGGTIYFPTGEYNIEFSGNDSTIEILFINGENLKIIGDGNLTKLKVLNENPQKAYKLFNIKGNTIRSIFKVENLELMGPINPGTLKQLNKNTQPIIIGQGNIHTYVDNVKISNNFFSGIVSSGGDALYDRLLSIKNSDIEVYGSMCAGVFGATRGNELQCDNVYFRRAGLASNETSDNQAYGVSIYCHCDVSVIIKNCKFYDNHRNAIQFASTSALYFKKYPYPNTTPTKYQIIENNYFDSTATDGIQLGFYYPNPIVRGNTFNNWNTGISVENSTIVDGNYFGKCAVGIEHNAYGVVSKDSISIHIHVIRISNNNFANGRGLYILNNHNIRNTKIINSNNNRYDCKANICWLGSHIVGDTSDIVFNSNNDVFISPNSGGFQLNGTYKLNINNATMYGTRLFFSPATSTTTNANNRIFVNGLTVPNPDAFTSIIHNYTTSVSPIYDLQNVFIDSASLYSLSSAQNTSKIFVNFRKGVCPIVMPTNSLNSFSTNYDTYYISGTTSIATINLFNYSGANASYDWKRLIQGEITLIANNGFSILNTGNIGFTQTLTAGQSVTMIWNRDLKKWIKK